jgi:hypothetical protein
LPLGSLVPSYDPSTEGARILSLAISLAHSKRLGHKTPEITLRIHAHLFKKDDSKVAAIFLRLFASRMG